MYRGCLASLRGQRSVRRMSHRDKASFGKRQEFVVIAELLRRGFDVYMTLVDDQQIDCVLRFEAEPAPRYVDLQIKARSRLCKKTDAARFANMRISRARASYF